MTFSRSLALGCMLSVSLVAHASPFTKPIARVKALISVRATNDRVAAMAMKIGQNGAHENLMTHLNFGYAEVGAAYKQAHEQSAALDKLTVVSGGRLSKSGTAQRAVDWARGKTKSREEIDAAVGKYIETKFATLSDRNVSDLAKRDVVRSLVEILHGTTKAERDRDVHVATAIERPLKEESLEIHRQAAVLRDAIKQLADNGYAMDRPALEGKVDKLVAQAEQRLKQQLVAETSSETFDDRRKAALDPTTVLQDGIERARRAPRPIDLSSPRAGHSPRDAGRGSNDSVNAFVGGMAAVAGFEALEHLLAN